MVSDRQAWAAVPDTPLQPRIAWFRGTCFLVAFIAGTGAVILAELAVAWGDTDMLGLGLAAATLAVWLVIVGRGAADGRELHAVLLLAAGVWIIASIGLLSMPGSSPALALATLIPLVFAAPYLPPRRLAGTSVVIATASLAYVLAGAIVLELRDDDAFDSRHALDILGWAAVTLLVLFLVNQASRTATGLRVAALHDALTGLHNRALFIDRLEHAMTRSQRRSSRPSHGTATMAVVYLDIDGFKDINDRHGHGCGDAVLRAVAVRLQAAARASDTVARIGGDEFAVLVEDIADRSDVIALTDRLMETMSDPIVLPEGALPVRLSAGVAFSDDGGGSAEELLQNADHAMYHAKRRSPGEALVYEPGLRARSEERRRLKRALRHVVDRGELRLYYQPVVRLADGPGDRWSVPTLGTIVAFEALVRWHDPKHGLRGPGEFIGLAEETGDIVPIGRWVLETACRQLREWQSLAGRNTLSMMVNLSPLELERRGFGEGIAELVAGSGITPHSLVLEMTERAVVPDSSRVRSALEQLQDCGVHLVIDDFGTGYSSLSYLGSLPIDGLKIARPFVRDAVGDQQATALLRAISDVGSALGAVVVAEGIETAEELRLVRSIGCHLGQGYLLSRPLDAAAASSLLRATRAPWQVILEAGSGPAAHPSDAPRHVAVMTVEEDAGSVSGPVSIQPAAAFGASPGRRPRMTK